jgi:hypothetical protein
MRMPAERRKPFRTPRDEPGPGLIGSLDNTAEVLAIAEGESLN